MGAYAWGPLAPFLQESLNLTHAQIGLITSALYIVAAVAGTPAGFMADRFGTRLGLLACLGVMGTGIATIGLFNSYLPLILLAAFAGIGYGIFTPVAAKSLALWFEPRLRATAMGIRHSGVTIGGAIGGILIPFLAISYGWRMSLVIVGAIMFIPLFVSLLLYREHPKEALAFSSSGSKGKSGFKEIFSYPSLVLLFITGMFLCFGQGIVGAFFVLYLKEKVLLPVVLAGACFMTMMIAGAVSRIGWGVISDRLFKGRRKEVLIIIAVLGVLGSLGSAFLYEGVPQWVPFLIAVALGMTYLGFQGVMVAFITEISGPTMAGRATGVGTTIVWIGMTLGPIIFGLIADSIGYFWGWVLLAGVTGITILLFSLLREKQIAKTF
jgi:MFS family permease